MQGLPAELKEAVEKIVEPAKPEPTLTTKLKQAVGTLKQLSEKKAALQAKTDSVKAQYSQLLQELKEMQNKIETTQKDLQNTTMWYNQQLEKDKQTAETDEMAEEITAENFLAVMSSVGMHATSEQVKDSAQKLSESAVKRRKCG